MRIYVTMGLVMTILTPEAWKGKPQTGRNYLQRLVSKTGKELLKFNNEKTNNSILKWVKAQNTHLSKGETQMAKKHTKRCSTSEVSRRIQMKTTRHQHTYQSGWNPEIWPHPVLTRTGRNRNSHSLPVGLQDGAATLEDKTPVSYKTKHTLTLPHTSHTPWCLFTQWAENMSTQNPHKEVYSSFINKAPKGKQPRDPVWTDKQTVGHAGNEILLWL